MSRRRRRPLSRRLRRRAGGRRGAALPLVERCPRSGARRRPHGRRRGRRAGADPCALPVAARAQPRRRARRADPLPGARRARRPPPRLGAPDPHPDAEARRRPARGGDPRSPPGARAAQLALRWRPTARRARASPRPSRRPPQEVEDAHNVAIEVVAVGDASWTTRPLPWSPRRARRSRTPPSSPRAAGPITLYAEAADDRVQVFVHDRGQGFDADAVPDDRRGLRESIVGRMERHGGRAVVTSAPGEGTEVELVMERSRGVSAAKPTVVIVDDHAIFRAGVRAELEGLVEVQADVGLGRGGGAPDRRAEARRRPARRAHARRRRGGGDPAGRAATARPSGSSPSRCRTPPRT